MLFVLATLGLGEFSAVADDAVFLKKCGSPRPDLELCLLWNRKTQQGSLAFQTPGTSRDEIEVVRQDGERKGIEWYVGFGTVKGSRLYLWLRVDDSGQFLPVEPRPPRTAALFYRYGPNQRWESYPSSTQFLFSDVK